MVLHSHSSSNLYYFNSINIIYDSRKLSYQPQTVDYESIDKIVLDYYLKTYHKEIQ